MLIKIDELQKSAEEVVKHHEHEIITKNSELIAQSETIKRLRAELEQSRVEFDALVDYFEHTSAPMPSDPRRITYRDILRRDHPDRVSKCYGGGCCGCPSDYGYRDTPASQECIGFSCRACWDRRVGE